MRNHCHRLLLLAVALALYALLFLVLNAAREPDPAQNGDRDVEVLYFTADPAMVNRNGDVNLSWHVRGVDTVTIQIRYGSYKQEPDVTLDNLPAETVWTHNLTRSRPGDPLAVPYIHYVAFWLLTPGESSSPWLAGYTLLATVHVQIVCPYDGFFFGDDSYYDFCPLAKAQTVEAVYQPFEDGFLLWRSDNDTIYVFRTFDGQNLQGTALRFTAQKTSTPVNIPIPPLQIPAGRCAPDRAFSVFLNDQRQHGIIIGLGWPTAPGTTYQATVQDSYNDTFHSAVSYMRLPDSRVIRYLEDIYTSGWLRMTCKEQQTRNDGEGA